MKQYSGKKLQYFDPELNESYVPYVVETSVGLDRMFLATLSTALQTETLPDNTTRDVLKLHPALAPVKATIMPLVKKDGLPEKAREIMRLLQFDHYCQYDEKDSIGKRYRRQDAIGTPFCITVDHQTMEDQTVTIRHRDSMQQERVAIASLSQSVMDAVAFKKLFA
jgi:glycyl-tRNA synthetase